MKVIEDQGSPKKLFRSALLQFPILLALLVPWFLAAFTSTNSIVTGIRFAPTA